MYNKAIILYRSPRYQYFSRDGNLTVTALSNTPPIVAAQQMGGTQLSLLAVALPFFDFLEATAVFFSATVGSLLTASCQKLAGSPSTTTAPSQHRQLLATLLLYVRALLPRGANTKCANAYD